MLALLLVASILGGGTFFFRFRRDALLSSPTGAKPASSVATPRTVQNRYGIELVHIPPGSFQMGSTSSEAQSAWERAKQENVEALLEWFMWETPKHIVKIEYSFFMGRAEVTQGQWQAVMGTTLREQRDKEYSDLALHGEGDNYPMHYVSWDEAKEFVARLNQLNDGYVYRLPSEAEWEYACRAGTTGDYYGDVDVIAWYGHLKAVSTTHVVGTKQANAFGLYDMSGNVWEWCEDVWHADYNGAPTDGSAWVSGINPRKRVIRGGSWFDISSFLRSSFRDWDATGEPNSLYNGFRVVAMARK